MRPPRAWTALTTIPDRPRVLWLFAVLAGACFQGEFLQGRECDVNSDCGTVLECLDGICGGRTCGNGVLDDGEECDDGNDDNLDDCTSMCRFPKCGDGIVQQNEDCDDGNLDDSDSCRSDCRVPACGDGHLDTKEECDDGNLDDSDSCTSDCLMAVCGDGHLSLMEECDDGNDVDDDGCSSICKLPGCGDGVLQDDENCCGDGVVQSETGEHCDDGNLDNSDSCTELCEPPACDDGITSGDETDVDCGGSCTHSCRGGQDCVNDGDCISQECEGTKCVGRAVISAGDRHTCAVLASNSVRCWGWGEHGQLGYGGNTNVGDTPDTTPSVMGDVNVGGSAVHIAPGRVHTCVLLEGGLVRCWGDNETGQLGDPNILENGIFSPPSMDVGFSDVIEVVTDGYSKLVGPENFKDSGHTCALLEGNVSCWGDNSYGQIGYPNVMNIGLSQSPVNVEFVDVGYPVVQIAAGSYHTCALLEDGNVRCWGFGESGRLGYSDTDMVGFTDTPESKDPVEVGGSVKQVTAGAAHTCALLVDMTVRCWGSGASGRLGYGNTDNVGDDQAPASAGPVGVGGDVTQITAGGAHTCALLEGGTVRCWGKGSNGQLGYGNPDNIGDDLLETPASAGDVDVGGLVIQIAAGGSHTCALLEDESIRCWGRGADGQLGYGDTDTIGDNETPASKGPVPYLDPP